MNIDLFLQAHKYLYYCKGTPVLSDYAYDMWCRDNDLESSGGSDLESSYSDEVKELAAAMQRGEQPSTP